MGIIGRIFDSIRGKKTATTAGTKPNGLLGQSPSVQRQWATGHGLAWWASDHLEELNHILGWTHVGIHAVAKQFANSKVTISRIKTSRSDDGGLVTKSHIPDANQEQKTALPNHPLVKLFKKPNRVDSWATFMMRIAMNLRATGGFIIWEIPNQLGQPLELWCIPRAWATPILPSPQFPQGAWRITPSTTTTGSLTGYSSQLGMVRDAREFIASGYPHPLYPGEFQSPLSACAQQIDLAEMTDQAAWAVFNNAIMPGMVFSVDPNAKMDQAEMDRFIAQLQAKKGGVSNRGEALLLNGVTKESLNDPLTGLQHIDGRDQNRDTVLATQGVAPIAVGLDSDGSYSGSAAKLKGWIELSIQPDLNLVATAFQSRWSPVYGDDLDIAIDARGYDDPTLNIQQGQLAISMKAAGVKFSDNEMRAFVNKPPIPGGDAYEEVGQQPGGMPGMPSAPQAAGQPPAQQGQPQDGQSLSAPPPVDDGAATDAIPEFDLEPELADDEEQGEKNPLQQAANGNRIPKHLLNGFH